MCWSINFIVGILKRLPLISPKTFLSFFSMRITVRNRITDSKSQPNRQFNVWRLVYTMYNPEAPINVKSNLAAQRTEQEVGGRPSLAPVPGSLRLCQTGGGRIASFCWDVFATSPVREYLSFHHHLPAATITNLHRIDHPGDINSDGIWRKRIK